MIFRIRYAKAGGHVHCRLFAGPHEGALGKCGDIVMRIDEFDIFKAAATFMQFVPEALRGPAGDHGQVGWMGGEHDR